MSTREFNTALRAYTAQQIAEPGDHDRNDMAQAFLAEHRSLAEVAVTRLVERQVGALIKELCDADADDPQMALFSGLPAAIAVAPGRVKAIEHCTPEDLQVGETHRQDNIKSARERLNRYRKGVAAYLEARRDDETVGQTAHRLGGQERSA